MLSITAIERENGPACNHLVITVNHEGTPRSFKTTFTEIDEMFGDMAPVEQLKMLVLLWAKYRRSRNRAIAGVEIA